MNLRTRAEQFGRSRSELHLSRVEDFATWAATKGWVREDPKGEFEMLRMRNPEEREPLIVHARDQAKEHGTLWGQSLRVYLQWRSFKKREGDRLKHGAVVAGMRRP